MNGVLLTAGVIAILAAVLGGGLQAFDMTVPVVDSRARQALLFAVGVGFLGAAFALRETDGDGGVGTYREAAKASCDRMATVAKREIPVDAYAGGPTSFRKDALLADLRDLQRTFAAELDALLDREAPESLRDERDAARAASDAWLTRFASRLDALAAVPKDVVTQADANVLNQGDDAQVRVKVNDAMSALAGTNCAVAGA